jgi:hypothetical protein
MKSTLDIVVKDYGATTNKKKPNENNAPNDTQNGTPGGKTGDKPDSGVGSSDDTGYADSVFIDLIDCDWAKDAIFELASKNIILGTSENTFSPHENIKRADYAILLVRAMGYTETGPGFDDVPEGAYYAEELAIARASGLVNGVGGNNYYPTAPISREDMMVIMARALGIMSEADESVLDDFVDASDISDYAKDAVSALVKANLISGSFGKINPKGYATRAEVAVLLYRVLNRDV